MAIVRSTIVLGIYHGLSGTFAACLGVKGANTFPIGIRASSNVGTIRTGPVIAVAGTIGAWVDFGQIIRAATVGIVVDLEGCGGDGGNN